MSTGKIVQISGPVVDCEFADSPLPKINTALKVTVDGAVKTLEVAEHIGGKTVRCLVLSDSFGLARAMEVRDTGAGITVPVGEKTLGRILSSTEVRLSTSSRISVFSSERIWIVTVAVSTVLRARRVFSGRISVSSISLTTVSFLTVKSAVTRAMFPE